MLCSIAFVVKIMAKMLDRGFHTVNFSPHWGKCIGCIQYIHTDRAVSQEQDSCQSMPFWG